MGVIISKYNGPDLNIFANAQNWNSYLAACYARHLAGRVLEVGAGIGSITQKVSPYFSKCAISQWVCLEPDKQQCKRLMSLIKEHEISSYCIVQNKLLCDLPEEEMFDTILYSDVLEHIEDDKNELAMAIEHLNPGGRLIVMSPAHSWLFSELDNLAGHYRRYSKKAITDLTPKETDILQIKFLDSAGISASIANKLILKRGTPTLEQIVIWDQILIRISRWLDFLLFYKVGKSILVTWEKRAD